MTGKRAMQVEFGKFYQFFWILLLKNPNSLGSRKNEMSLLFLKQYKIPRRKIASNLIENHCACNI